MGFVANFGRRLGILEYLGTWNAATNSPSLQNGIGQKNGYYIVSAAGTTSLDSESDWGVGDWAIFNGSTWEKIDNSDQVGSGAEVVEQDISSAGWSSVGSGMYQQTVTMPAGLSYDATMIEFRTSSGAPVSPGVAKASSTSYTLTVNDSGLALKALYLG